MEIISCIVCTADRFPNYSELKKHLTRYHSEISFIKCCLCFRPYLKANKSAMDELKAHYKESHGIWLFKYSYLSDNSPGLLAFHEAFSASKTAY